MKLNTVIVIIAIYLIGYNAYSMNIQAVLAWSAVLFSNLTIISYKKRYES